MKSLSLKQGVRDALRNSINAHLDRLSGTTRKISELGDDVLSDICTQFTNAQLLEMLPALVQKEVQAAVNQRTLDGGTSDQDDLFSDAYADRLIKHGNDYVCKTADATWPILVEQDRRRFDNMNRQMRSYERERKRMDALADAGMAANPEMTVRDAMAVIRES